MGTTRFSSGFPLGCLGITPTLAIFRRIFERRQRHQLATAMSDEVVLHPAVHADKDFTDHAELERDRELLKHLAR